jgi:hypothetical protein
MSDMMKDINFDELSKDDMLMNLMNGAFPEPMEFNKEEHKKEAAFDTNTKEKTAEKGEKKMQRENIWIPTAQI